MATEIAQQYYYTFENNKKETKSCQSDTTVNPKTIIDSFLFCRHHHQHFHRQYYISQK